MSKYDKFIMGVSGFDVCDTLGFLKNHITPEILLYIGYFITFIFLLDVIVTLNKKRKLDIWILKDILFIILAFTPVSFLRASRFIRFAKLTKYIKHLPIFMRCVNGICLTKDLVKKVKK